MIKQAAAKIQKAIHYAYNEHQEWELQPDGSIKIWCRGLNPETLSLMAEHGFFLQWAGSDEDHGFFTEWYEDE